MRAFNPSPYLRQANNVYSTIGHGHEGAYTIDKRFTRYNLKEEKQAHTTHKVFSYPHLQDVSTHQLAIHLEQIALRTGKDTLLFGEKRGTNYAFAIITLEGEDK